MCMMGAAAVIPFKLGAAKNKLPNIVLIYADDAPDSFNVLSALTGKSPVGRDHLVEHAGTLSLIKGHWKYIEPSDGAKIARNVNIELGNDPEPQLYNLKNDLGERHNLAAQHPEIVKELASLLEKIRRNGRSRSLR